MALLLLTPALGMAQDAAHPSRGQGYFFVGPIMTNYPQEPGGYTTGFGGEALFFRALGAGADAEFLHSTDGANMGNGSVDMSYHFVRAKHPSKFEPFAIGGWSIYFGQRSAHGGFNLGGGLNYWVARHVALRVEVRENAHIGPNEFLGITHFAAFRFGVTFR